MIEGMRRVLFTVVVALSLVLFFADVGMWIRSYWVRDLVSYVDDWHDGNIIQSIRGRVHVMTDLDGKSAGHFSYREDRLVADAVWNGGMSGYPVQIDWRMGHVWQNYTRWNYSFDFVSRRPAFATNHRLIVIPYWSPAVVLAILPGIWIWRFVRERNRRVVGHCPKCGYDLRATPQRCPECGWKEIENSMSRGSTGI